MKELRTKIKEKSLSKSLRIILLLLPLVLFSCKPFKKSLAPLSSSSVESSRNKGILLIEYYPVSIKIYDTINFVVKEVFSEKQFRYTNYEDLNYKVADDKFQVKIIMNERLSNIGHFDLWTLEGFTATSPFSLINRSDGSFPPDTILVKILKVDINSEGLAGMDDGTEIGSFVLRRKYGD